MPLVQRVRFFGKLDAVPDPDGAATGYRQAVPTVLVPRGVPGFKVLER